MRTSIHFKGQVIWVAALLAVFMFSHGAANAALSKEDQKCVNSINKGAAKVAATQGKENAACIKNGGKDKLPPGQSVEECLTDDPKNKVSGAIGKIKVGDCASPPAFPAIDTDKNSIGPKMVDAELDLIHAVFGTDLDAVVASAVDDKPGAKCQAAVAKAISKCLDTKFKEYNGCKKNKLKGKDTTAAENAGELRVQCMADATTGAIPDGKGKIAKKCVTAIGDTLSKKCGVGNVGDLITGCSPVTKECIDQKVKCEVCGAINDLDGLGRYCDSFDDGSLNGSCDPIIGEIGQADCDFDEENRQCVGGPFDGQHCDDWLSHSDCRDGPGQTWRCIATARAFLARVDPNATDPAYADLNPTITFALNGGLRINCGSIDPNTGKAPCTCALKGSIQLEIGQLTTACLQPLDPNNCAIGQVDCDGDATGLSVSVISDHDIGDDVAGQGGPPFGPFGYFCGLLHPAVDANDECDAMCEYYCANLPGNYTKLLSGCEGFCRGGVLDGERCELSLDAPGQDCEGPTLEQSGFCVGSATHPVFHHETCGCGCIELGGGPSPEGALVCQVPILTTQILPGETCGVHAPFVIQGRQCVPFTTEKITATILDPNLEYGDPPIVQSDVGFRKTCVDLKTNNLSGFVNVGNIPGFDGDLGDSPVEIRPACEDAAFGEPFARPPSP
jgi:hypothetical protein